MVISKTEIDGIVNSLRRWDRATYTNEFWFDKQRCFGYNNDHSSRTVIDVDLAKIEERLGAVIEVVDETIYKTQYTTNVSVQIKKKAPVLPEILAPAPFTLLYTPLLSGINLVEPNPKPEPNPNLEQWYHWLCVAVLILYGMLAAIEVIFKV